MSVSCLLHGQRFSALCSFFLAFIACYSFLGPFRAPQKYNFLLFYSGIGAKTGSKLAIAIRSGGGGKALTDGGPAFNCYLDGGTAFLIKLKHLQLIQGSLSFTSLIL